MSEEKVEKKTYKLSFTDKVAAKVAARTGFAKSVVRRVIIATWEEAANQIKEDNGGNIPHIVRISGSYRAGRVFFPYGEDTPKITPPHFQTSCRASKEIRDHFKSVDPESEHGIRIKVKKTLKRKPGSASDLNERAKLKREEAMRLVYEQMSRLDKEAHDFLMKQRAQQRKQQRALEALAEQENDQSSQAGS